jgi:glycosyltransferase involved in cell wall biosynthesis
MRGTGHETYLYNLIKHLALLEPNGDTYLIYLDRRQSVEGVKSNRSFQTRWVPNAIPHFRSRLFYPFESWRKAFDVFHVTLSTPVLVRTRTILTVCDLSFERFPEFFPARDRTRMKLAVSASCRRADHIITISESSKRDLVELYRLDPERVTVTYPGPAEIYKPVDIQKAKMQLQATYGIGTPFILYVGNLEPRKNLSRLLEAFAELKRKNRIPHKLVIVGQNLWLYNGIIETLRRNCHDGEVQLTGYVPSTDLPAFYNAASLLIYPSIFEGFGLPVVEAMACGTPVITSAGSSLEEIASGAAMLIDPYSVSSIAAAIEHVANSLDAQRRLRAAGLERAGRFSFRKMAEETRSVYRSL